MAVRRRKLKSKRGGARKNSGRKPIADKKIQLQVNIKTSHIEQLGGVQKLKNTLYEFIERYVEKIRNVKLT